MTSLSEHDLVLFFLQVCAMLAVALVFGQVMRRLGQPAVLGELLGGIVLGPTILGSLAPDFHAWLFPTSGPTALARDAVLQVGMLFFLFVAGLEVNLYQVFRRGPSVALTSVLSILLPFALGYGSVLLLPDLWQPEPGARGAALPLFVGTALSISALPVIARTLLDLDLMRHEIGIVVMAAATVSDLVGWSLFAVVLGSFVPGQANRTPWTTMLLVVVLSVAIVGLGRWLARPALRRLRTLVTWPSGFLGLTTVLILLASALVEGAGIHAVFGAFLLGVALADGNASEEETHAHQIMHQFALSFFAPLYFVSLGLRVDFVANLDLPLLLVVLCIASAGKVLGAGVGARLSGMTDRDALAVGFGLNARGAMEMILASVALQYGIIGERIFVALVITALLTSLLGGPVLRRLTR